MDEVYPVDDDGAWDMTSPEPTTTSEANEPTIADDSVWTGTGHTQRMNDLKKDSVNIF